MGDRPVVISGTDPMNPKSASDIHAYLRQLEQSLSAMEDHARWLAMHAGAIRDLLLDDGVHVTEAGDRAGEVVRKIKAVALAVETAGLAAGRAQQQIAGCGVRMNVRFGQWERRPR